MQTIRVVFVATLTVRVVRAELHRSNTCVCVYIKQPVKSQVTVKVKEVVECGGRRSEKFYWLVAGGLGNRTL